MNRYRRDLFPVSIYHGAVADNQKLKELLIPLIEGTKNQEDTASPPEGWMTDKLKTSFDSEKVNKFVFSDNEEQLHQSIRDEYLKCIDSFFDKPWLVDLSEIWYNVYENGEWQESHRHIGMGGKRTHFACVHFLSFDHENHSPLTFNDPLSMHRCLGYELENARVPENLDMRVREGDLIMFPAWLEHSVGPGKPTPNNPRITVAFNLTLEKYGEDEDE